MKFYLNLLAIFAISQSAWAGRFNITCFYDTFSIQRGGFANFTETDLTTSLEYCTHIVYGYVGLTPATFDIETLHPRQHQQFAQVGVLKNRYRHIKFLLSLGGDRDFKNPEKYMKLLESNEYNQQNFISSIVRFLRKYKFDGLDLAYQFPHDKLKKPSIFKNVFKKAKTLFNKNPLGQNFGLKHSKKFGNSNQILLHKQHFTALIKRLKNALRSDRLLLTLTLLPHINATKYVNIPAIINDLDFVNLGTFDYSTPERTPREANYLAPLHAATTHYNKPLPHATNIETEVHQWLSLHISAAKLNIGIAAYARAWRMTKALKSSVMPITSSLDGPAPGGMLTHTPGLFSLPEFCFKLNKMSETKHRKSGNYAYRTPNVKGQEGLFLTYDDQDSLEEKAEFVKRSSLGGVAIFDLTLDDFRGKCKGVKFPTLKAIKFKLY